MRLSTIVHACLALLLVIPAAAGQVAEYNIDIEYKTIAPAGQPVRAMTVGGTVPGPTIEAQEGDILRVTFNNKMDVATSIHWHGILLPPGEDGVPTLNTKPIAAHSSHTFEFPVIQTGTYWYHSHTGLQEQRGVYGAIVFHPNTVETHVDHDRVVVFSDWNNEDPDRVLRNLKRDGDYYALKKGSVQSWDKVIANGAEAIKARLTSAWTRMGPMDVSDIGYDAFLANGQTVHRLGPMDAGDTVRLRLVNAAASSYFDVEFAGGPMTIVSADGIAVEPIAVKRLRMAVAETYDVLVTLPDAMAYELRATAADGTGYSSTILGDGEIIRAPDIDRPNLFLGPIMKMDMGGSMDTDMDMDMGDDTSGMGMKKMEMPGMDMLTAPIDHMTGYGALRATASTAPDASRPVVEHVLELTGNMERYVWSINNRTLSESDRILIRKGDVVRFRMVNKTMMSHPMHLHGHFFRVLNGQGERSPLKHTVDVPPMSTVIIEFEANEERDWFFHCHVLYHMSSGMARVISYEGSSQASREMIRQIAGDRKWFTFADIGALSNMGRGRVWATNARNLLEAEVAFDWQDEYEVELAYARNINRWLDVYAGGRFEKQEDGREENVGTLGVRYILPLLIEADLSVQSNGEVLFELGSELQLASRIKFDWQWNTDDEFHVGLEYEISKRLSVYASHSSEFETGIGLMAKF